MKFVVERIFNDLNRTCHGAGYRFYENALQELIHQMSDKIGHPFIGDDYHNLRFAMNIPLYREFCITCQALCHDSDMYKGIKILLDPTLYVGNIQSPDGIVRLVYEKSGEKRYSRYFDFWTTDQPKIENNLGFSNELISYFDRGHRFQKVPHIDHVKFNGPATIVFWKDGTKTVVKHDGKGRKDKRLAILYAFIRKIYGEGKPYHNILNEIEEAIK